MRGHGVKTLLPIRRGLADALSVTPLPDKPAKGMTKRQHRSKLTDAAMIVPERRELLAGYVKWLEREKRAGVASITLWLGLDRGFVQRVVDLTTYRDALLVEPPSSAYKVQPPWK